MEKQDLINLEKLRKEYELLEEKIHNYIAETSHLDVESVEYNVEKDTICIRYEECHCSCCSGDIYSIEVSYELFSNPDWYNLYTYEKNMKVIEKQKQKELEEKIRKEKEEKEREEHEYQLFIKLKEKYKE